MSGRQFISFPATWCHSCWRLIGQSSLYSLLIGQGPGLAVRHLRGHSADQHHGHGNPGRWDEEWLMWPCILWLCDLTWPDPTPSPSLPSLWGTVTWYCVTWPAMNNELHWPQHQLSNQDVDLMMARRDAHHNEIMMAPKIVEISQVHEVPYSEEISVREGQYLNALECQKPSWGSIYLFLKHF